VPLPIHLFVTIPCLDINKYLPILATLSVPIDICKSPAYLARLACSESDQDLAIFVVHISDRALVRLSTAAQGNVIIYLSTSPAAPPVHVVLHPFSRHPSPAVDRMGISSATGGGYLPVIDT